ncbi:MAG TPA: Tat pathway signal protein [Candidatus Pelethomonas intestinigallinarum]|nr:Tat pathway signal protein [Candidatus Pelethomonas intestinigallinarum]
METTHTLKPSAGLTETGLKWIALVTMVLDHIHYFFGFTGAVPEWFSMAGRVSAPLFLFCLVEGFTHTRSRKKYFAKVYVLSAAMSALLFFMAFGGILVRPDGFYPGNGMMTTFAVLMVIWQGIDWLEQRRFGRGLAAVLIPLAWPILANLLSVAFPALATPLGFAAYSVLPTWGTTGDSSWPVLVMGLVLYLFRRRRKVQVAAFSVYYVLYGVVYMGLIVSSVMPDFAWWQLFTRYYEIYGILAAPLMLWYNGQRGRGHKALFYAFYPAHIYLLYALSWGLYLLLN